MVCNRCLYLVPYLVAVHLTIILVNPLFHRVGVCLAGVWACDLEEAQDWAFGGGLEDATPALDLTLADLGSTRAWTGWTGGLLLRGISLLVLCFWWRLMVLSRCRAKSLLVTLSMLSMVASSSVA